MAGRKKNRANPLKHVQTLASPLTRLKAVGPQRAALLAYKDIHTILDLLFFTPVRYEDRTHLTLIKDTQTGTPALVYGKVVYGREDRFFSSRKQRFKIVITDNSDHLELIWFTYRKGHIAQYAKPGTNLLVYGMMRRNRGYKQMIHPDVMISDKQGAEKRLGFYPVYSSVPGVSDHFLRSLIKTSCDEHLPTIVDPVPEALTHTLGLPNLTQAIQHVHFPPEHFSRNQLNHFDTKWHKRLVFDRFFFVMLAIVLMKKFRERATCRAYGLPSNIFEEADRFFPFRLTPHQRATVDAIKKDFLSGSPMTRLVMGDVGCGKTVVAALAAYMSICNDHQVAMMVPTQVLAKQHFEYFFELSKAMGFRPVLLTSEIKKRDRNEIINGIRAGQYHLIIGTHSLIQENVAFANLGLVIIDEQHRFGVRQRALMVQKGKRPHLLVMTATPIPRTLALTVYGEMDISVIKEFPRGHKPTATHIVGEEQKRWAFEMLRSKMSARQQAFVICPVIEGSEEADVKGAQEMEKRLKKALSPPFRIGLVHGHMLPNEREKIMEDFRKGLIDLLVGTTVIEVGIHVPNATVMVIEHPERFGLAQLHQLRGRVGRGPEEGLCLLIVSRMVSETAVSRLETLVNTHDGFEIAQKDLELRGHGELTGIRQAGIGELDISEMIREHDLLVSAKRAAQRLIESDPELSRPEHRLLRNILVSILNRPLDLVMG